MFKQAATISIAIILIVAITWVTVLAGKKGYFPPGALDPNSPRSDSFRNHWYSEQLEAMGEPVLKADGSSNIYRFTWLRSFHHPVAVRIVDGGGHCTLRAVELDGAGGYAPGNVFRSKDLKLPAEKCIEVEQLMRITGFWRLAPHEQTNGKDGAEWIVEGAATEYKAVARWSPKSGPMREEMAMSNPLG